MILEALAKELAAHPSILGKLDIAASTKALGLSASTIGRPGDDAAAIKRPEGGWDLLAGEGFMPQFVNDDPWFAGWCGVMVNLSDIAAMGGAQPHFSTPFGLRMSRPLNLCSKA